MCGTGGMSAFVCACMWKFRECELAYLFSVKSFPNYKALFLTPFLSHWQPTVEPEFLKDLAKLYIIHKNNELLGSEVHRTRTYSSSRGMDLSIIGSMISYYCYKGAFEWQII